MTPILPMLVADYSSPPPFVDRTYGEPLFHTESEVAVLCYAPDDSLWSVEESGILRQWSREGRLTCVCAPWQAKKFWYYWNSNGTDND